MKSALDTYIGRQPVLDRGWNVAGYELLFRSSLENFCDAADGSAATSQVIVNAVLGVGLDRLLGGKPAFVNFDRTLLLGDWTTVLPADKIVIEILETVQAEEEVIRACHRLREQGYALSFHCTADEERTELFAPFVDLLKVDFQLTSPAVQEKMIRRCQQLKIGIVAEKVETELEFRRASKLGYDYFQGYFFASPTVLHSARVPASQMNGLRLMKEVQKEDLNFGALEELIRHELSFSHALLKYLNSAAFHWAHRVESIRQALILLGSKEIRKWVYMASLSSMMQNRPPILMAQVLMRGRFCEVIAGFQKLDLGESDPFLAGMFSLLDAILNRPLEGILDELNIGRNIRSALLGLSDEADPLSVVLRIVKSWEVGDWAGVESAARIIGMSPDALSNCYLEASCWVDSVFAQEGNKWQASGSPVPMDFRRHAFRPVPPSPVRSSLPA